MLVQLLHSQSPETCTKAALAVSRFARSHASNQVAIAKTGGIPPIIQWLSSSTLSNDEVQREVQKEAASALLHMATNNPTTQVLIAKSNGIPPLIQWLAKDALSGLPNDANSKALARRVQSQAANAMLSLAAENATTQLLIAKSDGIPPLITLLHLRRSSREAQKHAACALWHLASQVETRAAIVESGALKPLIVMLAADTELANELAALLLL